MTIGMFANVLLSYLHQRRGKVAPIVGQKANLLHTNSLCSDRAILDSADRQQQAKQTYLPNGDGVTAYALICEQRHSG